MDAKAKIKELLAVQRQRDKMVKLLRGPTKYSPSPLMFTKTGDDICAGLRILDREIERLAAEIAA